MNNDDDDSLTMDGTPDGQRQVAEWVALVVLGGAVVALLVAYPLFLENQRLAPVAHECVLKSVQMNVTGTSLNLTYPAEYANLTEKQILKTVGCDLHGFNIDCQLSGCVLNE